MANILNQLKDNKLGVIALVILVIAAISGAIFMAGHSDTEGNRVVEPSQVKSSAEKQIEILEKSDLAPNLKAEQIAHQKSLIEKANGAIKQGDPSLPVPGGR